MLESRRKRRSALLPMTLALSMFAVGVAGYVATAGTPEFSRPTPSLPDLVFAPPSDDPTDSRSIVIAEIVAPNAPSVLTAIAETVGWASTPVPSRALSVTAASSGTAVQVLSLPSVPSTVSTIPAVPAATVVSAVIPVEPTASTITSATKPARETTTEPEERVATPVTATADRAQRQPKLPSGQNGRGAPSAVKAKVEGGGSQGR